MPLTSSRYTKIVGCDRVTDDDVLHQPSLIKEMFDYVREDVDNDFIESIHAQWIAKGSLSGAQLKGLINFHNKLVKD